MLMIKTFLVFLSFINSSVMQNYPSYHLNQYDGKVLPFLSALYIQRQHMGSIFTSHSAYVATETESNGAKIDGLLPPNFM